MAVASAKGSEDRMKYPITEPGLFVIIHEKEHNIIYEGEDFQGRELNYGSDERRILKLIHPKAEKKGIRKLIDYLKHEEKPHNIKVGVNLTKGDGKDSFNYFMTKEVLEYAKKHSPSFVMFFLLTHGFENGRFLLATKNTKGASSSEGNCCNAMAPGDPHQKNSNCHARHIVHDIIAKVATEYPNIPKIFVIQSCRGSMSGIEEKHKTKPESEQDTASLSDGLIELFIPDIEDTLVLRACVERCGAWVFYREDLPEDFPEGGSLLIQTFCDAAEELIKTEKNYEKLLDGLSKKASNEKSDIVEQLEKCREDVTGGWIMNICQHTSNRATNYMPGEIISLPGTLGRMLQQSKEKLFSNSNSINQSKLLKGLKGWKTHAEDPKEIQELIDLCEHQKKGKKRALIMLEYLWKNVIEANPVNPLQMSAKQARNADTQAALNRIIANMRAHAKKRIDKQQPHISSSLSRKLSFLEILDSQRRLGNSIN
ncbi:uncharacterized protein [Watersipora subatra]|uniref:uncharacterized protein n=1 Tax=Watersipora subatra TaxID=2589382 RepID=UPI00355ADCDA